MSTFSQMTDADVLAHNARVAGINPLSPQKSRDAAEKECDLHYDFIKECKQRGWLYFHGSMAHATRRSLGEPDFTILADKGRVFFIEAKAKGGKLSPAQLGVKIQAEMLGHTVHIVESLSQFLEIVQPPTPTTNPHQQS